MQTPFRIACTLFCASALTAAPTLAQAVPHLSVNTSTYHTLVPASLPVTAAMCQPADTFCLANAVGHPLLANQYGYAVDTLGNIYVSDIQNEIVAKISPSGKPTLLVGTYGVSGVGFPELSGKAINTALVNPESIAVDPNGNLYIADQAEESTSSPYGSVIKVDPLGVATRLTADPSVALPPTDGASVFLQAVDPGSVATDAAGNLYFTDLNTCTVRKLAPNNPTLKVVAGSISQGCATTPATVGSSQAANTYQFAQIVDIATGSDGTLYLTDDDFNQLFSVTPDGILHHLAGSGTGALAAGPAASTGDIGLVNEGLTVDPYGDVYINSTAPGSLGVLVEVTKASVSGASQVVILTKPGGGAIEGAPENLTGIPAFVQLAFDPDGRLFLPAPGYNGVAYFDRNGSLIFDTSTGVTHLTLTYSNTGTAPLLGVPFSVTGFPYNIAPTAAQLAANGADGPAPFVLDENSGTCPPIFDTGNFVLAAGQSCTIVVDYVANPDAPPAGTLTFYTNDPLGAHNVSLSATPISQASSPNTFAVSTTILKPTASANQSGTFTVHATVISSIPGASGETTVTPTGLISIGVTNNVTGFQTQQTKTLDSTGSATVTFTGLKQGAYSLQGVYQGDNTSAPDFSPVDTLYVLGPIDFTVDASVDGHLRYEAATPQFLNFNGQAYTNPRPILFQDLIAGNTAITFNLYDSTDTLISTTSTAPLGIGNYTVKPVVANAAALDYSVTANSAVFNIAAADLTVLGTEQGVFYGQYLTTGTPDSTHFSLANNIDYITSGAIFQSDLARGTVMLNETIQGATVNPATAFLPAGHYLLQPVLSGPGAVNYSMTAYPGFLVVKTADITIEPASRTVTSSTLLSGAMLCTTCYTAPNASLLTTDPNLVSVLKIYKGSTLIRTVFTTSPSTFTLPPGTYNVRAVIVGAGVGNYSLSSRTGILTVQ